MCKLRILFIIFFISFLPNGNALTLESASNGTITIDYEGQSLLKNINLNNTIKTITARVSQVSTTLTLFTTTMLHLSGYTQNDLEQDMGYRYHSYQQQEQNPHIYSSELFMFLGLFGTSLASYRFGTENDMMAIIPVFPRLVEGPNGGSIMSPMEEKNDNLQYGVYFYFSRNF